MSPTDGVPAPTESLRMRENETPTTPTIVVMNNSVAEEDDSILTHLTGRQLQRALAIRQAFAVERIKAPGEEISFVLNELDATIDNQEDEGLIREKITEIVSDRAKIFNFVLDPLRTQIGALRQQNAQMWQDNANLTRENARLRQQIQELQQRQLD